MIDQQTATSLLHQAKRKPPFSRKVLLLLLLIPLGAGLVRGWQYLQPASDKASATGDSGSGL